MERNHRLISGLLAAIVFFASCTDQLLNPQPESILTTSNAYNTAKDINLATLGIYNNYQARIQTDYELMETPSDNAYGYYFANSPGMAEIALLEVSPENPKLNAFWKSAYNGIFRANTVLANIDNPTDYTGTQKDQYSGEARFMRALLYFDLVRIFGGVPSITQIISPKEAAEIPRATEQEIYTLITTDLQDAISKLPAPGATVVGRASKAAAIALMAKVSVYRKDWPSAKTHLEQLFSEYNYTLVNNFRDLFNTATENNSETIFAIPYVSGTNGQSLTAALAPHGGILNVINQGNRTVRPTWDLHSAFAEGDTRFTVTITERQLPFSYKPGDEQIWFPYFNKWIVPAPIPGSSGLDIPVLRLADMILLYAETLYYSNQPEPALVQLNRVRTRAFGNTSHNYLLSDIATEESFMDKLLLERRLELAMENDRWFDLVRTGRFTSVLTTIDGEYNPSTGQAVQIPMNAQAYMRYFPIPWEQIQLASPGILQQNEGYD